VLVPAAGADFPYLSRKYSGSGIEAEQLLPQHTHSEHLQSHLCALKYGNRVDLKINWVDPGAGLDSVRKFLSLAGNRTTLSLSSNP
jgi:hypothetical protein